MYSSGNLPSPTSAAFTFTYNGDYPTVKEGYLEKRGGSKGGWKTWKKRWFVLDTTRLAYFKDKSSHRDGQCPLGGFNITRNFSVVPGSRDPALQKKIASEKHPCYFELEMGAPPAAPLVMVVRAGSPLEYGEWVDAIKAVRASLLVEYGSETTGSDHSPPQSGDLDCADTSRKQVPMISVAPSSPSAADSPSPLGGGDTTTTSANVSPQPSSRVPSSATLSVQNTNSRRSSTKNGSPTHSQSLASNASFDSLNSHATGLYDASTPEKLAMVSASLRSTLKGSGSGRYETTPSSNESSLSGVESKKSRPKAVALEDHHGPRPPKPKISPRAASTNTRPVGSNYRDFDYRPHGKRVGPTGGGASSSDDSDEDVAAAEVSRLSTRSELAPTRARPVSLGARPMETLQRSGSGSGRHAPSHTPVNPAATPLRSGPRPAPSGPTTSAAAVAAAVALSNVVSGQPTRSKSRERDRSRERHRERNGSPRTPSPRRTGTPPNTEQREKSSAPPPIQIVSDSDMELDAETAGAVFGARIASSTSANTSSPSASSKKRLTATTSSSASGARAPASRVISTTAAALSALAAAGPDTARSGATDSSGGQHILFGELDIPTRSGAAAPVTDTDTETITTDDEHYSTKPTSTTALPDDLPESDRTHRARGSSHTDHQLPPPPPHDTADSPPHTDVEDTADYSSWTDASPPVAPPARTNDDLPPPPPAPISSHSRSSSGNSLKSDRSSSTHSRRHSGGHGYGSDDMDIPDTLSSSHRSRTHNSRSASAEPGQREKRTNRSRSDRLATIDESRPTIAQSRRRTDPVNTDDPVEPFDTADDPYDDLRETNDYGGSLYPQENEGSSDYDRHVEGAAPFGHGVRSIDSYDPGQRSSLASSFLRSSSFAHSRTSGSPNRSTLTTALPSYQSPAPPPAPLAQRSQSSRDLAPSSSSSRRPPVAAFPPRRTNLDDAPHSDAYGTSDGSDSEPVVARRSASSGASGYDRHAAAVSDHEAAYGLDPPRRTASPARPGRSSGGSGWRSDADRGSVSARGAPAPDPVDRSSRHYGGYTSRGRVESGGYQGTSDDNTSGNESFDDANHPYRPSGSRTDSEYYRDSRRGPSAPPGSRDRGERDRRDPDRERERERDRDRDGSYTDVGAAERDRERERSRRRRDLPPAPPSGRVVFPSPEEVRDMSDREFNALLRAYAAAAKRTIEARAEAFVPSRGGDTMFDSRTRSSRSSARDSGPSSSRSSGRLSARDHAVAELQLDRDRDRDRTPSPTSAPRHVAAAPSIPDPYEPVNPAPRAHRDYDRDVDRLYERERDRDRDRDRERDRDRHQYDPRDDRLRAIRPEEAVRMRSDGAGASGRASPDPMVSASGAAYRARASSSSSFQNRTWSGKSDLGSAAAPRARPQLALSKSRHAINAQTSQHHG